MVNLSFLHGSNVSVTAGISLWESRISCFCCIFYSMPYVAGANLMTLDKELFERVQKRREQVRIEGSRGKHRPNKKERLIFSGVLICAECGCPYSHIQPSHKKERYGVPK